jgi:hypothetical protein
VISSILCAGYEDVTVIVLVFEIIGEKSLDVTRRCPFSNFFEIFRTYFFSKFFEKLASKNFEKLEKIIIIS